MYHLLHQYNKDNKNKQKLTNINYQFAARITICFLQQTFDNTCLFYDLIFILFKNAFTLPVIICLFVSNANSFSLHFYSKKKETNSYCTVAGYNMLHCTVRSVVDTLDWFLRYSLSCILTICPSIHYLSFILDIRLEYITIDPSNYTYCMLNDFGFDSDSDLNSDLLIINLALEYL